MKMFPDFLGVVRQILTQIDLKTHMHYLLVEKR